MNLKQASFCFVSFDWQLILVAVIMTNLSFCMYINILYTFHTNTFHMYRLIAVRMPALLMYEALCILFPNLSISSTQTEIEN